MINSEEIRKDFPIFNEDIAYLDSAATTQRPNQVLEAVNKYYKTANANPHRGTYGWSIESTRIYDEAREVVAHFINAPSANSIVFTKNATESLNLIANTYGMDNIHEGDKVLISILEHHSNLVPWQRVTRLKKANLNYLYVDENGEIPESQLKEKIVKGTKIVGITYVSNALGTITQIKKIIDMAHKVGAIVVVDGSQAVPHKKIDVQELDADFLVFSGHKLMSPLGIGVLYGKLELLDKMSPFLMGGDMIEYVYEQEATFAKAPTKFEAGTQNVGGAVGLAAAIKYLEKIGMEQVSKIEHDLLDYAKQELGKLNYIQMYGPKDIEKQASVISFAVQNVHPHDVSSILDSVGVAIRAGNHCAQPLMRYMGIDSTCRASFYIYNTKADIDRLINGLEKAYRMFSK